MKFIILFILLFGFSLTSIAEENHPDYSLLSATQSFQLGWEAFSTSKEYSSRQKAANYFKDACDKGHSLACFNLAFQLEEGDGVEVKLDQAATLYSQVCFSQSETNNKACNNLGALYLRMKNDSQAFTAYQYSCNRNSADGCLLAGMLRRNGRGKTFSFKDAKVFFEKSCQLRHPRGCFELAIIYDNGLGLLEDNGKAREYYKRSCSLGDAGACTNLGVMLEAGSGGVKDVNQAAKLYEESCRNKAARGCYNLGVLIKNVSSKHYFQRACKLGLEPACDRL